MCMDKSKKNCRTCPHNGETADCPKYKAKATCAACLGTHYKSEMICFYDMERGKDMYICKKCADDELVAKAVRGATKCKQQR